MLACYPGNGTHYIPHVDNPNKNGRILTALLYLNCDWNKSYGGYLRIYKSENYQSKRYLIYKYKTKTI